MAYKNSELFGYGVLQRPQARDWEERLQVFLYTGEDLPDDEETFYDENGTELYLTNLLKWKTDRLAVDSELRKSVNPPFLKRSDGLVALVKDDPRGEMVLTVMFMAAGLPLPDMLKAALPAALDWAMDDAVAPDEEGGTVWPEPHKRLLILTAFQHRVAHYNGTPIYVGGPSVVQGLELSSLPQSG